MVKIRVITERGVEDKKVPQCFSDVQWCDYVNAICADVADGDVSAVLSALTGISVKDMDLMSLESQSFIFNSCSFFWNEQPEYVEIPEKYKAATIADGTWLQLINAEAEFKTVADLEKPQIAAAQMIIKTYTKSELLPDGVDVKGMKVPEALGYWTFFFCSLKNGRNAGSICTQTNQTTMNLRLASKRYNGSDGSPHYTRLQKGTCLNTIQSSKQRQVKYTLPYYLKRRNGSTLRICSTSIQRLINR
mgnify:CR=1 FL=1